MIDALKIAGAVVLGLFAATSAMAFTGGAVSFVVMLGVGFITGDLWKDQMGVSVGVFLLGGVGLFISMVLGAVASAVAEEWS